jgi:hypothetical protein
MIANDNKLLWKPIVQCVTVVIIIVIVLYMYNKHLSPDSLEHACSRSESIYKYKFKTGDLLMTSGKKLMNIHSINKIFTGSPVNHVGVIYVDPVTKEPWVWETLFHGFSFAPLEYIIKYRKQKFNYAVKSWNIDIPNHVFYNIMMTQVEQPYLYNYDTVTAYFRSKWNRDSKETFSDKNRYTCGHFVAQTYQHLGLFDRDSNAGLIFPSHFFIDDNLPYAHKDIKLGEAVYLEQ